MQYGGINLASARSTGLYATIPRPPGLRDFRCYPLPGILCSQWRPRYSRYLLVFGLLLLVASCQTKEISLFVWNVQNLSDGSTQGGEYAEFDPTKSAWNTRRFQRRVADLASVIRSRFAQGPDILVLAEVENEAVLRYMRRAWFPASGYSYLVWRGPPKGGMGLGVLSRLPLTSLRTHQAYFESSPLRPLLELGLTIHGVPTLLFAAHWKSRREGQAETEGSRLLAADMVRRLTSSAIQEGRAAMVLLAGDLNTALASQSLDLGLDSSPLEGLEVRSYFSQESDSYKTSSHKTALVAASLDKSSAWDELVELGNTQGTYFFRGQWEQLDHVLRYGKNVPAQGAILEASGTRLPDSSPNIYDSRRYRGLSDHLPVMVIFNPIKD